MYSSSLDSVRNINMDNRIMAELSLMRAALSGNPAVLSPNQAMDSLALQEIILANNREGFRNNSFCEAVELGIVKIALPEKSLLEYCQNVLRRSEKTEEKAGDKRDEFIISGLKFLYEKDGEKEIHPYEERLQLREYLAKRFENAKKRYISVPFPDWLTESDEKAQVERYIESIILLDHAVWYYENKRATQIYFPSLLKKLLLDRVKKEYPDSQLANLIGLIITECENKGTPNSRSYFYRFLTSLDNDFSIDIIQEVKAIVDLAYNRAQAISVSYDSEENIPERFNTLSDTVIEVQKPDAVLLSSYETESSDIDISVLDWGLLVDLYQETKSIMERNGCDWATAVETNYKGKRYLPIKLIGTYSLVTGLKLLGSFFLPATIIASIITEATINEVTHFVGNKIHLPDSVGGAISDSQSSIKSVKMLDRIIHSNVRKKRQE